jgi:hypothetical protein
MDQLAVQRHSCFGSVLCSFLLTGMGVSSSSRFHAFFVALVFFSNNTIVNNNHHQTLSSKQVFPPHLYGAGRLATVPVTSIHTNQNTVPHYLPLSELFDVVRRWGDKTRIAHITHVSSLSGMKRKNNNLSEEAKNRLSFLFISNQSISIYLYTIGDHEVIVHHIHEGT